MQTTEIDIFFIMYFMFLHMLYNYVMLSAVCTFQYKAWIFRTMSIIYSGAWRLIAFKTPNPATSPNLNESTRSASTSNNDSEFIQKQKSINKTSNYLCGLGSLNETRVTHEDIEGDGVETETWLRELGGLSVQHTVKKKKLTTKKLCLQQAVFVTTLTNKALGI